jgi:hypothetical protein
MFFHTELRILVRKKIYVFQECVRHCSEWDKEVCARMSEPKSSGSQEQFNCTLDVWTTTRMSEPKTIWNNRKANLLCNAPTITARCIFGNIVVTCVISASLGTRTPVVPCSFLPVSSLTHSRMTEPPVSSVPAEGRAVAIISSFPMSGLGV